MHWVEKDARMLRALVVGTGARTGSAFFESLVGEMASACRARWAFVAKRLDGEPIRLRVLALWDRDHLADAFDYSIAGTPCEDVVLRGRSVLEIDMADRASTDRWLVDSGVRTYLAVPFLDGGGHVAGIVGVMHDAELTESALIEDVLRIFAPRAEAEVRRVRADSGLRRRQAEVERLLIARAAEGVCVCRAVPEPPFVQFSVWNDRMIEITGYSMEEINRRGWYQTVYADPEVRERAISRMASMREGDDLLEEEWVITRADGQRRILQISTSLVSAEGGPYVLALMRDVTERRREEQEFARLKRFHEELLENMSEGIAVMDAENRWLYVNPAGARMLGYGPEEVIGRPGHETVMPEATQALDQAVEIRRTGRPGTYELLLRHRSGRAIPALVHAVPRFENGVYAGSLSVFSDLTIEKESNRLQRELDSRLRQAEKQEALGSLAAGIAHDFNNVLAVIVGGAQLASQALDRGESPGEELRSIVDSARRGRELVRSILSFARRGEDPLRPSELSTVVRETVALLRQTLPSSIELRESIQEGCPLVDATAGDLQQALLNLCSNAAHAMRGGSGTLEIAVVSRHLDGATVLSHSTIAAGDYVLLTVTDTGVGMTPSVLQNIFEPYFTTKAGGEGTGLGLASVLRVVRRHGGGVDVRSTPGCGSTFDVYLPVGAPSVPAALPSVETSAVPLGHERVLCVDDEALLVRVWWRFLSSLGYAVTVTTSAEDALARVRATPEAFDLLLTDQTMPGMTGLELARAVRALRPGLPIVLCTGQPDWLDPAQLPHVTVVLEKPFENDTLARHVRAALDAGHPSAA